MNFIEGKWVTGKGLPLFSINPADNSHLWNGYEATEPQVQEAVLAAKRALPAWRKLSFEKRLGYLTEFREMLKQNLEELATGISREVGKPLWESRTEVNAMINKLEISVAAFHARTGITEKMTDGAKSITRHKPQGVIAVFGPFNFPGHLPNGHIIPALLAGNTVIFKSSEMTPWVAEKIISYWEKSGLPAGVLNLIQGGKKVGSFLLRQNIDGVFFTGSYETGKMISHLFGERPEKIIALEMGGNNPLVVAACQNAKAAAYSTILSAFITTGQRCSCARRLIVVDDNEGLAFLDELLKMSKTLKIGAFSDEITPFMGPLIRPAAAQKVLMMQDVLIKQGGIPLQAATILKEDTGFISPGMIDITEIKIPIDKEIFGPFLQITRVKNIDEAIARANQTEFGLCAGLFSDDKNLFEKFYEEVNAGIINWNRQLTGAASDAPFGGIGKSGNHRPSAYYAADYCAYPVASLEIESLAVPSQILPGITIG